MRFRMSETMRTAGQFINLAVKEAAGFVLIWLGPALIFSGVVSACLTGRPFWLLLIAPGVGVCYVLVTVIGQASAAAASPS